MPQQMLSDVVQVAVYAPDPVVRVGLVSCLQHDRRLSEISSSQDADVTVVAVDTMDVSVLDMLPGLCNRPDARFVVVAGRRWHAEVSASVDHGVRAVLWRDSFTPAVFTRTLMTVTQGGGSLPPTLQGRLMEQVQRTHREVLTPRGLTASGVSQREVDVLRLVAEGRELSEIAEKLSYSERTVKYVLYGLMKRLQLRNRAHAVSYAIRTGLI
ncbi:response regulator transcription factor [Streptomyces sp. NPDC101152]|uniref:helix-turn-helix transcriptional regulator n=1 Tax=Streptomyces sp. NPDC101152 TaxID=3366116 RepID=UPI00382350A9